MKSALKGAGIAEWLMRFPCSLIIFIIIASTIAIAFALRIFEKLFC